MACGCLVLGLATTGQVRAESYQQSVVASDADCDDACETSSCCRGLSFCNKLKMHCVYHSRKCCRPYRRLDYIPPELAPYIGPGTWSAGYGAPYGGAACPPWGYAPGYGAPAGFAR
jgi:hypothetical protein